MNIVGLPALVGTYDNYIWIIHNSYQAWVVDPGESEQVINYLTENQLSLQAILITHQHFDHIDGIDDLLQFAPQIPVYGPKNIKHPAINSPCAEGDIVKLSDKLELHVLEIPGHTKDHIAFYNDELLFCGDTLFTAGCGRILGGTAEQFSQSILKLRSLPDHLQFYCGHEYTQTNLTFAQIVEPENLKLQNRVEHSQINYPAIHKGAQSTLGLEKATNPFLRFDTPALQAKLMQRGASASTTDLFSALRAWKDEFDRTH